MKKLIMWNVISLDGYYEGEEAWDLSFHDLVWGRELEEFSNSIMKSADLLVFGANTYKGMFDYWSKAEGGSEDEVARYMNRLPKIVCSREMQSAEWENTTIVKDAVTEIPKIKQEGEGNIFVFGSGNLSESLIKADLFDEYYLCVSPVMLGRGKRLFGNDLPYKKLLLIEAKQLETGGVLLMYAVKREG